MLIQDDWVCEQNVSKRSIRRLGRRRRECPKWLVYGLMIAAFIDFVVVLLPSINDYEDTASDWINMAVFFAVFGAGILLAMIPLDREQLRRKLWARGDLYPSTDLAYQMILTPEVKRRYAANANTSLAITYFLRSMRGYENITGDPEWFLTAHHEADWQRFFGKDGHGYITMIAKHCACQEELPTHVRGVVAELREKRIVATRTKLDELVADYAYQVKQSL